MRQSIICLLLLISFSMNAQTLSEKEIDKLNYMSIKTEQLNLNELSIQNELNKILALNRKRKTNKTVAIVLTSIAASGILLGGIVVANGSKSDTGGALSSAIGGMAMAGGAIYGGISIPFWSAAKKRKKERDTLIKLF